MRWTIAAIARQIPALFVPVASNGKIRRRMGLLHRKSRVVLPIVAAMCAWLGAATVVLARAGGGGGFHGGGGGGFGGGGGGGGGGNGLGWLIYFWVRFCFEYPLIGLPVTAGVLVVIYLGHQQGRYVYQNSVIRRGGAVVNGNLASAAAASLAARDPSFSEQAFYQRVSGAFAKIQAAWCAQNLQSVRPFISDGIHERFSIQFEEQKAFGYRDQMEGIRIESVLLAEVVCEEVFEVATLRICAFAVDYRVAFTDGRRISGSTDSEPFVEFWSFLRRRGVKSDPAKPGLMEGHCPNCGAAIEMNQSAQCEQCRALLRSGQFDWVLAEITQESEWRPNRRGGVAGANLVRKTDPAFNRIELEDRVSVMFWRKAMADRLGKIDPLRKIAADSFCETYAKSFQLLPDGKRLFFGDCAVGSVNAIGVLTGEEQEQAVVEVWWEGARMNDPHSPTTDRIHAHHLFILQRKAGLHSDPDRSVSSAHCPNCGAPTTDDLSSACSFCGSVMNDGSRGWVLGSVVISSAPEAREILSQIQNQSDVLVPPVTQVLPLPTMQAPTSGLLAWAIKTALADGVLDIQEKRSLATLAAKSRVPADRLAGMIDMAQRGMLQVPDPPDAPSARAWLTAIADVAVSDGVVQDQELALLTSAGRRFGFSDSDISLLLRQQRQQRLADAKAALRVARSGDGSGA